MKPTQIESVEQLCRALVQIPSENPSGAPESKGEAAMAQFVALCGAIQLDPTQTSIGGTQ